MVFLNMIIFKKLKGLMKKVTVWGYSLPLWILQLKSQKGIQTDS